MVYYKTDDITTKKLILSHNKKRKTNYFLFKHNKTKTISFSLIVFVYFIQHLIKMELHHL